MNKSPDLKEKTIAEKKKIAEEKLKKRIKFSKKIIVLVVTLNTLFAAAVLTIFCIVGSEPSGLVVAFYGFTTVELWNLSKIKRDEIKGNKDQQDDCDVGGYGCNDSGTEESDINDDY